jgi:hypothetical protein
MRSSLLGLLGVILAGAAAAADSQIATDPPAPSLPYQWATWVRLAGGVTSGAEADTAARGGPAGERETERVFEAAVGADVTFAIDRTGALRIGPWIEVRGFEPGAIVGGGELVIQAVPRELDLFWYEGQGVLAVRAGGNHERVTGQVAYGYLAPWKQARPDNRYMIGVRFIGTVTRTLADARAWTATIGLELEPVGALRYLLGIRSWYR